MNNHQDNPYGGPTEYLPDSPPAVETEQSRALTVGELDMCLVGSLWKVDALTIRLRTRYADMAVSDFERLAAEASQRLVEAIGYFRAWREAKTETKDSSPLA